ncbi:hypothetical protein SEA_A3WALLY_206 [Microbacterium phage A3Wally]|nr:hypothetical protein SEA_A3WALLY_206 [Microbacterium phage A3Wally]
MDAQADPWSSIAPMPPWWVQQHRLVEVDGQPWTCTCGARGRAVGGNARVHHYKHQMRAKKKHDAFTKARKGKVQHARFYGGYRQGYSRYR